MTGMDEDMSGLGSGAPGIQPHHALQVFCSERRFGNCIWHVEMMGLGDPP